MCFQQQICNFDTTQSWIYTPSISSPKRWIVASNECIFATPSSFPPHTPTHQDSQLWSWQYSSPLGGRGQKIILLTLTFPNPPKSPKCFGVILADSDYLNAVTIFFTILQGAWCPKLFKYKEYTISTAQCSILEDSGKFLAKLPQG